MKIWYLKSCDTCRAALKALPEAERVEIRVDGLAEADVARFLEAVGADVLMNRRSTTWRGLSEAERAGDPAALLLAHPTLMKRPVIETPDGVFVGWSAETRTALGCA